MNAYQKLQDIFTELAYFEKISGILAWDEAVVMPNGSHEEHSNAMAVLEHHKHDILINPKINYLIQEAKQQLPDNQWDQANLKLIEKQYKNATALAPALVKDLSLATNKCMHVWKETRKKNDWKTFEPHLKKVIKLIRESATIRAEIFNLEPYDILIDDNSPGMTQALIDPLFTDLQKNLSSMIDKAMEKRGDCPDLSNDYKITEQKKMCEHIMKKIGFNFQFGRLDSSHHPFCGGHSRDVRITTTYDTKNFLAALMAICHETGHAICEQNLPIKWSTQPVGKMHSMTIHESQSLLIESYACQSYEFASYLASILNKFFKKIPAISAEKIYKFNTYVDPGLIRIYADEMTYPLHVILRYEIEKKLLSGSIEVEHLPEIWNEYMEKFLGLSTKGNYENGVMQDIHWPSGAFGYFPSYVLGAVFAAQQFAIIKKQHPNVFAQLACGDFTTITNWTKTNIHSYASKFDTPNLIKQAVGDSLNLNPYLTHLKERYL